MVVKETASDGAINKKQRKIFFFCNVLVALIKAIISEPRFESFALIKSMHCYKAAQLTLHGKHSAPASPHI